MNEPFKNALSNKQSNFFGKQVNLSPVNSIAKQAAFSQPRVSPKVTQQSSANQNAGLENMDADIDVPTFMRKHVGE